MINEERISVYAEKLKKMVYQVQKKLEVEKGPDTKKMSGAEFEQIVYETLVESGFDEGDITHRSQKFPDFIITDQDTGKKIGIEVKKTDSSKWEIIGGSIYESLKNDIEDTYVLMAKLGGVRPEVRLRKYDECISDLKVTHNPRFYLDLDLDVGEDFLTQNNANDLLELSEEELNRKVRKLLRSNKSTWWNQMDTTPYSALLKEEKEGYLNDGLALLEILHHG